jgi:hypothetical protein
MRKRKEATGLDGITAITRASEKSFTLAAWPPSDSKQKRGYMGTVPTGHELPLADAAPPQ